ncbi:hypothetical protein NPIL_336011 [Nephila pilipes]|uniref:Uncharacterized protein n=1 Tax=Nephila pilipes TaxID=299642 RepID=A0A8X6P3X8_NEPPI|nr:hypothetical protein NPIL_336011 [Nephila pilipes]
MKDWTSVQGVFLTQKQCSSDPETKHDPLLNSMEKPFHDVAVAWHYSKGSLWYYDVKGRSLKGHWDPRFVMFLHPLEVLLLCE